MSLDANTEIVRRVYEDGLNHRDRAVFDALVAPDYVNHESSHGMGAGSVGAQNWTDVLARLAASFPDISWRVLRTLAQGDQVWVETAMSGTHEAAFFGSAPTGRRFDVRQVHLLRLEGGLVREHWAVRDDLGVLVQLGLVELPTPAQSAAR
jgi:predicted ester cyclase